VTALEARRRTDGCAVEQGDAADEVRAGLEPRPSQLIPGVGPTVGGVGVKGWAG